MTPKLRGATVRRYLERARDTTAISGATEHTYRAPPSTSLRKPPPSSVSATPLQLAVMAARIATGREVRPRIVRLKGDLALPQPKAPKIDIPDEYLALARAGMNAVMNEPGGTAWRSRIPEPEWQIAGKTGTSQVYRITEEERRRGLTKPEDLPWARRDHALFVCFGPYDSPRYACAVVVEHGIGGSRAAAPKAQQIMRAVLEKDPAKLKPIGPEAIAGAPDLSARG